MTQQGPNIIEQYWCENCGYGLPNPSWFRGDVHKPAWKFCPICGEAIQYDMAQPVQRAALDCERCGCSLIKEVQVRPNPQYAVSHDYVGGPVCRRCMEEHCAQTNCLQCEVGKYPNCPYTWIKKSILACNDDPE